MKFRNVLAAAALSSMAISPALAQTSPSLASAPAAESEEAFGGGEFLNALIIIGIAAVGMIILAASDDDEPVSP